MKQRWAFYRLTCYLLLVGSIFWLGRMGYASYIDSVAGPTMSFNIAILIFVPVGWFQVLSIRFLEEKIVGDSLLKKLDSWAYYLLLRLGGLASLLLIVLDIVFVFTLFQNWTTLDPELSIFFSLSALIIFTGCLIYNLVAAIRFKRFLIKKQKELQQSFLDSIGSQTH